VSHQVLGRQFSSQPDLPEEKSINAPDPQNIIPEKEDQDIGDKPN
jgi:hypothetical protein